MAMMDNEDKWWGSFILIAVFGVLSLTVFPILSCEKRRFENRVDIATIKADARVGVAKEIQEGFSSVAQAIRGCDNE